MLSNHSEPESDFMPEEIGSLSNKAFCAATGQITEKSDASPLSFGSGITSV
jgi:hypothetical protein